MTEMVKVTEISGKDVKGLDKWYAKALKNYKEPKKNKHLGGFLKPKTYLKKEEMAKEINNFKEKREDFVESLTNSTLKEAVLLKQTDERNTLERYDIIKVGNAILEGEINKYLRKNGTEILGVYNKLGYYEGSIPLSEGSPTLHKIRTYPTFVYDKKCLEEINTYFERDTKESELEKVINYLNKTRKDYNRYIRLSEYYSFLIKDDKGYFTLNNIQYVLEEYEDKSIHKDYLEMVLLEKETTEDTFGRKLNSYDEFLNTIHSVFNKESDNLIIRAIIDRNGIEVRITLERLFTEEDMSNFVKELDKRLDNLNYPVSSVGWIRSFEQNNYWLYEIDKPTN